jgi:hypothetical protein
MRTTTVSRISFVAQSASNSNAASHRVVVPRTAGKRSAARWRAGPGPRSGDGSPPLPTRAAP